MMNLMIFMMKMIQTHIITMKKMSTVILTENLMTKMMSIVIFMEMMTKMSILSILIHQMISIHQQIFKIQV